MPVWEPLTDEEERANLEGVVDETHHKYREYKQGATDATTKFIVERSKNARKEVGVVQYAELLTRAENLHEKQERKLKEFERQAKVHSVVANTTERRVEYERGKTAEAEEAKATIQEAYQDLEYRYDAVVAAAQNAERVADKERARVRRAKEVRAVEELRAAEMARAVVPLERPVAVLQDEWTQMQSTLDDFDGRLEESRDNLVLAIREDTKKHTHFQDLLFRLPVLQSEQQQGYMSGAEIRSDYNELMSSIHMQVYQQAFFNRTYEDAGPSVIDGSVAMHVAHQKDLEWQDPWGVKGVGHWVVKFCVEDMVEKLEAQEVVDVSAALEAGKKDYEEYHVQVMNMRSANDDLSRETRMMHERAEALQRRLEVAQTRLARAQENAEEASRKAEEARIAQEDQELLAEDTSRFTDNKVNERITARVAADEELVVLEAAEGRLELAKFRLEKAEKEYETEREVHKKLMEGLEEIKKQVKAGAARVAQLTEFVEIKKGERDWQKAKEEVAQVRMEGALHDTKKRFDKHLEAKEALIKHRRRVAYQGRVQVTVLALKSAAQDARAFTAAAHSTEDDLRAFCAQPVPQPGTEAARLHEEHRQHLEALAEAMTARSVECTRQVLGGNNDAVRAERNPMLVTDPSWGWGGQALRVGRCAKVFEKGGGAGFGASFRREQATSRPSAARGWVSETAALADKKYTGLCHAPLGEGRHSWDFQLDEVGGKGMVYLGVVRDRDAFEHAEEETRREVGSCIYEKTRTCFLWELGGSEVRALDLDAYCLGDDERSWAIASDGVKVHNKEQSEFCGTVFGQGDVITCMWDSKARTLAFVMSGRRLGATMENVAGPVVPAVSVTRTRTCSITVSNYTRH